MRKITKKRHDGIWRVEINSIKIHSVKLTQNSNNHLRKRSVWENNENRFVESKIKGGNTSSNVIEYFNTLLNKKKKLEEQEKIFVF